MDRVCVIDDPTLEFEIVSSWDGGDGWPSVTVDDVQPDAKSSTSESSKPGRSAGN